MLQSPPTPRNPKLKRRNAMRVKNRTVPRVTRSSLRQKDSTERSAGSQNSSPAEQNLHRCQNLEARLHSRRPIVADAVILDQRQDLTNVLNEVVSRGSRRTLRCYQELTMQRCTKGGCNLEEEGDTLTLPHTRLRCLVRERAILSI